jgi:phospholipase/carboxylesterase
LSPMVPFEPVQAPDLKGTSVFIGAGRRDPIVSVQQVERLGELLADAGASVTTFWQNGGHNITNDELTEAQRWIASI